MGRATKALSAAKFSRCAGGLAFEELHKVGGVLEAEVLCDERNGHRGVRQQSLRFEIDSGRDQVFSGGTRDLQRCAREALFGAPQPVRVLSDPMPLREVAFDELLVGLPRSARGVPDMDGSGQALCALFCAPAATREFRRHRRAGALDARVLDGASFRRRVAGRV